jgi:hypothetical protein
MPLIGRRRPILRAAAVGAGAYHAGKKREQSQQREYEQEQRLGALESQPAAPPPPTGRGGMSQDAIEQLKQLGELHDQGVLTDEEFATQKAKLLGG